MTELSFDSDVSQISLQFYREPNCAIWPNFEFEEFQFRNEATYLTPSKIRQCDSLREFKRLLKTHLFGDHDTL